MLNVLFVDDEQPAHDVLLHHCRAHPDIKVVGHCYNAAEALAAIDAEQVDLMFLDIRMPRFGGFDLLRGLRSPPLTVVVSAHREHALEGYDLDVVDYLLKPVSVDRFVAAMEKVRRRLAPEQPEDDRQEEDLILKVDRMTRRFRLADVVCFEAQGNFVKVWIADGASLATVTLRRLLEVLPARKFVQIHKSYIVNRAYIVEKRARSVRLVNGMEIPIGKSHRTRSLLLP